MKEQKEQIMNPYDGPLKRLLEKYFGLEDPNQINISEVEIPEEIRRELELGNLAEDFQIDNFKTDGLDSERILLGLAGKLYGVVGLKQAKERFGIVWYTNTGEMRPGLGVSMTYTICHITKVFRVTCQNFQF
jgi:hypothetical protein